MNSNYPKDITRILNSLASGDSQAVDDLVNAVYGELHQMARAKLSNEEPGNTLQPTALVHEAWLRLKPERQTWDNRKHFFVAAAQAMRRILIDSARRKLSLRKGGGGDKLSIEDISLPAPDAQEFISVSEALDALAEHDPRKAQVAQLRYIVGMTSEEVGDLLGISVSTAKREWDYARAWLYRFLSRD